MSLIQTCIFQKVFIFVQSLSVLLASCLHSRDLFKICITNLVNLSTSQHSPLTIHPGMVQHIYPRYPIVQVFISRFTDFHCKLSNKFNLFIFVPSNSILSHFSFPSYVQFSSFSYALAVKLFMLSKPMISVKAQSLDLQLTLGSCLSPSSYPRVSAVGECCHGQRWKNRCRATHHGSSGIVDTLVWRQRNFRPKFQRKSSVFAIYYKCE